MMKRRLLISSVMLAVLGAVGRSAEARRIFWRLDEMIVHSDVVALIKITQLQQGKVHPGDVGSCHGPGQVQDMHATFEWVERWCQSPLLQAEPQAPMHLRIERPLADAQVEPGEYVAFLRGVAPGEFVLVRLLSESLYAAKGDVVEFPIWLRPSGFLEDREAPVTRQQVKAMVFGMMVPDQIQTFETPYLHAEECGLAYRSGLCRFDADVSSGVDRAHRMGFRGADLLAYSDCALLDKGVLDKNGLLTSRESPIRVSGRWEKGFFQITKITYGADGRVILTSPDHLESIDQKAAIAIAKRTAQARTGSKDQSIMAISHDERGWHVMVELITGYDKDGQPESRAGEHMFVRINDVGTVTDIVPGQ